MPQNGSQMAPKLPPGGFREALGRSPQACGRPCGAEIDFLVIVGSILGTVLARKIVKKSVEKRGPVLNDIFGLWRPFGTVVGSFWGAFWLPNRAVDRIAKTTKSDDVTALFKVFSGSGGSKID